MAQQQHLRDEQWAKETLLVTDAAHQRIVAFFSHINAKRKKNLEAIDSITECTPKNVPPAHPPGQTELQQEGIK
jgi:hypothetical protein